MCRVTEEDHVGQERGVWVWTDRKETQVHRFEALTARLRVWGLWLAGRWPLKTCMS